MMTWILVGAVLGLAVALWVVVVKWQNADSEVWYHTTLADGHWRRIELLREEIDCRDSAITRDREAREKREAELVPALKWARSFTPGVPTAMGYPDFLLFREGESFDQVLDSIRRRYEGYSKREAERASHDAVERELDARQRLVPRKRARKGRAS